MSRTRHAPNSRTTLVSADPILLETDLREWAGEHVARGGRRDALLGRVELLRLSADGRRTEARVRGNRPLPYNVKISLQGDRLRSECTCARSSSQRCRHAVAALEALRFPLSAVSASARARKGGGAARSRPAARVARPGASAPGLAGYLVLGSGERTLRRDERIELAGEEARMMRRQRARRERAEVTLLAGVEAPPSFGVQGRDEERAERVTLRGPRADRPCCSCDDYRENELQSCRHIERARGWYRGKPKQIPGELLSAWWRPRCWIDRVPDPLQEIRIDAPVDSVPTPLDRFFDEAGWLRPPPSDQSGSAWAREALAATQRAAGSLGWTPDLDELVELRIREAEERERITEELKRIDATSPSYQQVVPRLGLRLHPYQESGSLFLARRGRAFLADDMGLGKTAQAIAAALMLRRSVGAARALVVCPASLKYQWRREIEKVCGEASCVVDAARPRRIATYRAWKSGFLILNYELVLRDLDELKATLPQLVILDEAQRIKNWETKTARAVKQLRSPHAFVLTGTPLENRLDELHSIVEFLHPRALGPRWRLLPFHAVTEAQGRIIAYEGLDVLRGRLRGFFLRRERATVLDQLPERTENTFWTGMTRLQRLPYRKHAATVASLVAGQRALGPAEVRAMLRALTSMRVLCNASAQYAWDRFAERVRSENPPTRPEVKAIGSPKLEEFVRVLDDLMDESESKIVVFSQWERMLRLAHFVSRPSLERRDLRAEVFHGSLNGRARAALLEAFRLDPEFRVLFSTDAGGLGLNLQESASIVVNLEVPWNPAVLEQRAGRVHRMGQRRSVQILHFVTRGAIEERVRQIVESKRALFQGLLEDDVDRVLFDDDSRSSFVARVLRLIEGEEPASSHS